MIFQRGDFVEIRIGDQSIEGMVTLGSPNGKSLVVMFDGMIDGHVGMMPIATDDAGAFFVLMTGKTVTLAPIKR